MLWFIMNTLVFLSLYLLSVGVITCAPMEGSYPAPFKRGLAISSPPLTGKDVVILQNLLKRYRSNDVAYFPAVTGEYDEQTVFAVEVFQRENDIEPTGIFDKVTAHMVLRELMSDRYKDDGKAPIDIGYKYKFYIPVHKDRNIETNGTLLDRHGDVRFTFRVRAHGASYKDGSAINQLTTNGNTVTGLMTSDLNSKEPDPKSFGPYPVVRCVKGLKGNAAIGRSEKDTFISNYRSGILIHTGEWDNWSPGKDMPNSLGCMHVHPDDMEKIVDILTKELGIAVRKNPFGQLPYPYEPQGLVSIEQID